MSSWRWNNRARRNPFSPLASFLRFEDLSLREMALKAVRVADVPNLVADNAAFGLGSSTQKRFTQCDQDKKNPFKFQKFVVGGHRGSGMNMLQSSDRRMKLIKENSIRSFNAATKFPLDFIEFDVQVTRDDCPVIFHDNFILTEEKGAIIEKRVADLTLAEFLSHGPQKDGCNMGKPLFRKTKDGRIFEWKVEEDDPLCTLQEVFQKVESPVGFNIELKFDDQLVYKEEELRHVLQVILQVVFEHANDRPIMFSSFHPDAAQLMRRLQTAYPVFFITNGGSENHVDIRRNSLDEAIKVCKDGSLQGIVCEAKAIFSNPGAVARTKGAQLSLMSYGQLNNVPEVVNMQRLMGVEGVIVDLVHEMTEAVTSFDESAKEDEAFNLFEQERKLQAKTKPLFSVDELSLPQLIQLSLPSHNKKPFPVFSWGRF